MHSLITRQKLKKLFRYALVAAALVLSHQLQSQASDNHPPIAIYVAVRRDQRR